ncbi:unnamed protein product [Amoebophrya sp. A25]|nr:unnamed protein product [Amoebophrya sp. A25]|eukprot:GSA25T00012602001.1
MATLWFCILLLSASSLFLLSKYWDRIFRGVSFDPRLFSLQAKFLLPWYLAALAEWLQGPLLYRIGHRHLNNEHEVHLLLVAGYFSGLLCCFVIGSLADRYGRKRACQSYCLLYGSACILNHFRSFRLLLVSRVLSGAGTCVLYCCFDAWYVKRHRQLGLPEQSIQHTLKWMWFGTFFAAVSAGWLCELVLSIAIPYRVVFYNLGFCVGGETAVFGFAAVVLFVVFGWIGYLWDKDEPMRARKSLPLGSAFHDETSVLAKTEQGLRSIGSSPRLLALGAAVAGVEGALFVFLPSWDPSLTFYSTLAHAHGHHGGPSVSAGGLHPIPGDSLHRGAIFASLMLAAMAGALMFSVRFGGKQSLAARGVNVGERVATTGWTGERIATLGAGALVGAGPGGNYRGSFRGSRGTGDSSSAAFHQQESAVEDHLRPGSTPSAATTQQLGALRRGSGMYYYNAFRQNENDIQGPFSFEQHAEASPNTTVLASETDMLMSSHGTSSYNHQDGATGGRNAAGGSPQEDSVNFIHEEEVISPGGGTLGGHRSSSAASPTDFTGEEHGHSISRVGAFDNSYHQEERKTEIIYTGKMFRVATGALTPSPAASDESGPETQDTEAKWLQQLFKEGSIALLIAALSLALAGVLLHPAVTAYIAGSSSITSRTTTSVGQGVAPPAPSTSPPTTNPGTTSGQPRPLVPPAPPINVPAPPPPLVAPSLLVTGGPLDDGSSTDAWFSSSTSLVSADSSLLGEDSVDAHSLLAILDSSKSIFASPGACCLAPMLFMCFAAYEFALGFFLPLGASAKAVMLPEDLRATVCTLYRIPMNLIALCLLLLPLPQTSLAFRFFLCSICTIIGCAAFACLLSWPNKNDIIVRGRSTLKGSSSFSSSSTEEHTTWRFVPASIAGVLTKLPNSLYNCLQHAPFIHQWGTDGARGMDAQLSSSGYRYGDLDSAAPLVLVEHNDSCSLNRIFDADTPRTGPGGGGGEIKGAPGRPSLNVGKNNMNISGNDKASSSANSRGLHFVGEPPRATTTTTSSPNERGEGPSDFAGLRLGDPEDEDDDLVIATYQE